MTPKRDSDMVIQNRDKKALLRLQFEQQFIAVIFLSIYLPSPVDSITILNSGDVQELKLLLYIHCIYREYSRRVVVILALPAM
jgi:hypothetical protein